MRPVDKVTRLLEFDRQEEGCRDVDSLNFNTRSIHSTRVNLVGPEGKSPGITKPGKKVGIMLLCVYRHLLNCVRNDRVVVSDRHYRRARTPGSVGCRHVANG